MSVYYIHAPETGLVKIGRAANPALRLRNMQTGSPVPLVLVAVEDGDKAVERARHQRFAPLRRRGEWFALEGDLAEFVGALPVFVRPNKPPKGRRVTDIAAATGLSKSHVSQILSGKWSCSWKAALDIEKATGGAIDAGDLVPLIREARIGYRSAGAPSAPGPADSQRTAGLTLSRRMG